MAVWEKYSAVDALLLLVISSCWLALTNHSTGEVKLTPAWIKVKRHLV